MTLPGLGKPKRHDDPSPAWSAALKERVRLTLGLTMAELTAEQRVDLGRYHCLVFANCVRSEAANKRRGAEVAGGFARMATSDRYGGLTVGGYIADAKEYHALSGGAPWFDAWRIVAVDTDYTPPVRGRRV